MQFLYWLAPTLLVLAASPWLLGMVYIPEDSIGVVNKAFVLFGKHKALPDGKIIALYGEAGLQADALAPGLYFGYWPWQFSIEKTKFTIVERTDVGVLEANDGAPITPGRVLARSVECDSFQNARAFLENGGQRGPQIAILPPGTYQINKALFSVTMANALKIPDNSVGIVTTMDGAPLLSGEIAGKEIANHEMFQNGQRFIEGGGNKGLQEQVMLTGTYFTNPTFVTIKGVEMTSVPIGSVGVVIAYVGTKSTAATDPTFKQGTIVPRGNKGVWAEPLDPGKYPINPFTHKVELVPTTNIVLNWAAAKTEAHNLDKNLSTITVRSADGFTFNLDVSQIIHISRQNASKVIARFGNMTNLVTQVLEPLIGNYFRNSAQTSDVIEFLRNRAARQKDAREHIEAALAAYDVQAVDTLIGDITPPQELMKTLTDRKVAEQQQITFGQQMQAQTARAELEEQTALANTKAQIVTASRSVEIATLTAEAKVQTAGGDAKSKTINAEADATVLTTVGNAEATKTSAVGGAEADVLRKKVESVGKDAYAAMQIADFLASNNIKLVPDIQVTGTGEGSSGIVNAFLGAQLARMAKADGGAAS